MRAELIVFGVIAAFVVILSLTISIPQSTSDTSNLPKLGPAPELAGLTGWINSDPLTLSQLKGNVVLLDFWTFSCINCIRTLPYLKSWHEKYSSSGLVIIGVHAPEFDFEKNPTNVKDAVERFSIPYPVAQDNDYQTWRAYSNHNWPHKFLIDRQGQIRYDHIGEGNYEETEKAIQQLLNAPSSPSTVQGEDVQFGQIRSPEIYLGYSFARSPLGNPEGFRPEETVDYQQTPVTLPNTIYLSGKWKNNPDSMESVNNSQLSLVYSSKKLHIVAGGSGEIEVFLDSHPLNENNKGEDVSLENGKSSVHISGQRLYRIVSAPDYAPHTLSLVVSPGVNVYTFTFG